MRRCILLVVVLLVAGCERERDVPGTYGVGEFYGGPGFSYANAQGSGQPILLEDIVDLAAEDAEDISGLDLPDVLPDPQCMNDWSSYNPDPEILNKVCKCRTLNPDEATSYFCECTLAVCIDKPDPVFLEQIVTLAQCQDAWQEQCK